MTATSFLEQLETAIRAGAAKALRTRATVQRERAAADSAPAGEQHPGVVIRGGGGAIAEKLAATLEQLANELDAPPPATETAPPADPPEPAPAS